MREVYQASDPVNAEIVKDYLQGYGIESHVRGATLWGGRGELPADCYPSVWVSQPADFERARLLILQFEAGHTRATAWQCANCGERLSGLFTACWNCGGERP